MMNVTPELARPAHATEGARNIMEIKKIEKIIELVEDLVPDAPAREWRGPYGIHSGRGARRRAIEDAIEEEIRWFGCRLSPEHMAERASYRVTPVEDED